MATKIISRFSLGILVVLLLGVFAVACGAASAADKANGSSPAQAQAAPAKQAQVEAAPQPKISAAPAAQAVQPAAAPLAQQNVAQAPIQTAYAAEKATLPSFSGEIPPLVKDAVRGFYELSPVVVKKEIAERWTNFVEREMPSSRPFLTMLNGTNTTVTYLGYQKNATDTIATVETKICFGLCGYGKVLGTARVQLFLKDRMWEGKTPMVPEVIDFKILGHENFGR